MANNKDIIAGRSAGVLLHITSLPSPYGIGDLGPEANKFADFLVRNGQQYWQLLPLNPVERQQSFSPYSATSAMAGNVLLISPDLLRNEGLLTAAETNGLRLPNNGQISFNAVVRTKQRMLSLAWRRKADTPEFQKFCEDERSWIDDFAHYQLLKARFRGEPWYLWPQEYRLKKSTSLKKLSRGHENDLISIKWFQYLFFRQWEALKDHCNRSGIRMFGDLPFYISYDSVDVWANRDIFKLDRSGAITGIAGVPPDYFNRDGQLWGMPVFRWDVMQRDGYQWWKERVRKNLQLFDIVRLDHFRAFSSYWEVPAGEKTAVKGSWQPWPGARFFRAMEKAFTSLPFVAEDLGEITADVYRLRDDFRLPGMKVLQFAFGNDLAGSDHSPHNYERNFVAYTGTHDNNTSRGWYRKELDKTFRRQIADYSGSRVTDKNIHNVLARMVYASVAALAIIPMQDLLGLDERSRMNTPASTKGNWTWRLRSGYARYGAQLSRWAELFRRH